jgi:hypothetical protein
MIHNVQTEGEMINYLGRSLKLEILCKVLIKFHCKNVQLSVVKMLSSFGNNLIKPFHPICPFKWTSNLKIHRNYSLSANKIFKRINFLKKSVFLNF